MYNSNDFLAMLQSGKTPDEIATELTTALNKAVQEKNAKDAAANTKQRKVDAFAKILSDTAAFMREFYPDLAKYLEIEGVTAVEVSELLIEYMDETYDEVVQEFNTLQKLSNVFKQPKSDPIANFLKANHLS